MPELPEVETVARQLAPHLNGRTIVRARIFDPLLRRERTPPLAGRTILDVRRSGKRVLIELSGKPSSPPLWWAVHLRMTGRLIWSPPGRAVARDHLRARFDLSRGTLAFIDTRRFGTFHWFADEASSEPAGLDPLSAKLTPDRLRALAAGSSQNVKAWLLRQDRLVGLGNIYASEILFAAGISPERAAGSLDRDEARRLVRFTRSILRRAIRNCGTTFSDFQDARGVEGSYQQFLKVYDRAGQPCPRCREPIRRFVQQQRSTFAYAGCQT